MKANLSDQAERKNSNSQKTIEEKEADKQLRQKISRRISYRISDMLYEKGLQLKELADYLGISKQNLNSYIKAETHFYSVSMLIKIADFFDCSIDYLLHRDRADHLGFSRNFIAHMQHLNSLADNNDVYLYSIWLIEELLSDEELLILHPLSRHEKTINTIISEALNSFNVYYESKLSDDLDDKDGINKARQLLSEHGIKSLYRDEMLEYYQQLLSKRMQRITDEWLKNLFDGARDIRQVDQRQPKTAKPTRVKRNNENLPISENTIPEDNNRVLIKDQETGYYTWVRISDAEKNDSGEDDQA